LAFLEEVMAKDTMGARLRKIAASERQSGEACRGLQECLKAVGIDLLAKGAKQDFLKEMADQHDARADHHEACAKMCDTTKAAGTDDDLEKMTAAVATAVIDRIGNMMQPTDVRKVFQTADPIAVSGLTLVGRTGQPTPPTSMDAIPPELRSMVQE
jgi:hypothetical protein